MKFFQDGIDNFACRCATGYTGELCQHEINECASNPCQNNGECLDFVGDYKCLCPAGYSGRQCEVRFIFEA